MSLHVDRSNLNWAKQHVSIVILTEICKDNFSIASTMHMTITGLMSQGWTTPTGKSISEDSKNKAAYKSVPVLFKQWKTDNNQTPLTTDQPNNWGIWQEHTKHRTNSWTLLAQEKQELKQRRRDSHRFNQLAAATSCRAIHPTKEKSHTDKTMQQQAWTNQHHPNTTNQSITKWMCQVQTSLMIFIKRESHHQQEESLYQLLEEMNKTVVQWLLWNHS